MKLQFTLSPLFESLFLRHVSQGNPEIEEYTERGRGGVDSAIINSPGADCIGDRRFVFQVGGINCTSSRIYCKFQRWMALVVFFFFS